MFLNNPHHSKLMGVVKEDTDILDATWRTTQDVNCKLNFTVAPTTPFLCARMHVVLTPMLSSVVPSIRESAGVDQLFQPRRLMISTATLPALETFSKHAVVTEREPELEEHIFHSSLIALVTMEATLSLRVPLQAFLHPLSFPVLQPSIQVLEVTQVLDVTPKQQLAELWPMCSPWSTGPFQLVLLDAKPRTTSMQGWSMVKNVGVEMPLLLELFPLLLLIVRLFAWETQPSTVVEVRG